MLNSIIVNNDHVNLAATKPGQFMPKYRDMGTLLN